MQAEARAVRLGQTLKVTSYMLIAEGIADADMQVYICSMLKRKQSTLNKVGSLKKNELLSPNKN